MTSATPPLDPACSTGLFDLGVIGAGLAFAESLGELAAALRAGVPGRPPWCRRLRARARRRWFRRCWPTSRPPGAAGRPRIVVTQPRRVAARSAARRLAALDGSRLGDRVGYTVRGERQTGPGTLIEFVTPGILLRRLLADPGLEGTGAVILDEVHERGLETDLLLGMLTEVRQLRGDLTLVAMSATLDAPRFAALIGDAAAGNDDGGPAPVVDCPSALYPLEVEWVPAAVPRLDERGVTRAFLDHVADTAAAAHAAALAAGRDIDALVFVPGAWEVSYVAARLRGRSRAEVLELHGQVGPAEQDRAVSGRETRRGRPDHRLHVARRVLPDRPGRPAGHRLRAVPRAPARRQPRDVRPRDRVLLPGVRRTARRPCGPPGPGHGGPLLRPEDLRRRAGPPDAGDRGSGPDRCRPGPGLLGSPRRPGAGTAGRAAPGRDGRGRRSAAGTRRGGAGRPRHRAGQDPGPGPADPRLARALLDGAAAVGHRTAAEAVALVAGDQRAPGADLTRLLAALRTGRDPGSRRWAEDVRRMEAIARQESSGVAPAGTVGAAEAVGFVVALAFPDRVARRVPGEGPERYLLTSGTRAGLPAGSPLSGHEWLAVAEVSRAQGRDAAGTGAVIRSAAPLTADTAEAAARHLLSETVEARFSQGRVTARRERRLGAIVLSSTPVRPSAAEGRAAVARALASEGLATIGWSTAADALRRRLALLHRELGGPWPDVSEPALLARLDEWLAPELAALAGGASTGGIDLADPLRRLLPWPEAARLGELVPERLAVPSGSRIRIDYPDVGDTGGRPVVAVKLQECFGWAETPRLADGRVPVLFHLLSPARRPLAVTDDLASFWSGPYAQVRAEMRGRYPKHPWPEDPWTAPATARTKPRN